MPASMDPGTPGQQPGGEGQTLHWDGTRWLRWDGQSWSPMDSGATAPPPAPAPAPIPAPAAVPPPTYAAAAAAPPAAYATPTGTPPPPDDNRNPYRTALILVALLALLAAGIGGGVWLAGRNSTSAAPTPSAPVTGPPIGGDTGTVGTDIVTVPINTANDPFTPPAGNDQQVVPAKVTTPTVVPGGQVGLYGGTKDKASCDREQLIAFLAANPDKAAAWARVEGITVAEIAPFVRGLTSMILRTDTIVINHGYQNGVATPFTSVLQAGTAVLVNDRGRPVVRCYCGNPLSAPPTRISRPVYTGPTWPDWNPVAITVVIENTTIINDFTVINITTGTPFTRPTGTDGSSDGTSDGGATTTPAPTETSTPTPTATGKPAGTEATVFAIESIAGVSSGPSRPSAFSIISSLYVTKIMTYHYNNGGSGPGTIGLRAKDGTMYGPWQATGSEGQGGVANAYWTVTPNTEIPPGTYTIVDSNPGTWSWAADTGGRGIVAVWGIETKLPG